ncbi:MAG: ATP-dependent DNA helicase RecG [Bacillota bacterium]|nr:ATP-dependent DNA helicase RecG [Bacillota bacterium]
MNLYNNIIELKGIGPKMAESFNKCGIFTILDLVLYFPRDYEKIYYSNSIKDFNENDKIIIKCTVVKILGDIRTLGNRIITTIIFNDGTSDFKVKWFNQPYIKNKFNKINTYYLNGRIEMFNKEKLIINPQIEDESIANNFNKDKDLCYLIIPKYSLTKNLTNNFITKMIKTVLQRIKFNENMPKWIIEKYNFCSLNEAINNIHFPLSNEKLIDATKRLKFQELFAYSMKVLMLKDFLRTDNKGISFKSCSELKSLKEKLPFKLTNAQNKVMREILLEEKSATSMNRLVQGDVGSGKTIIAIIAMFNVVMNGYQAALMAPTEVLANQHFEETLKLLKDFNVKIKILTGSIKAKEKELVKNELKDGNIDIIIGTHALLQNDVEFKNLGMVVTDEQHRFGVIQRSKLFNKGKNIDILVMTATPIPRTLALYLYGDLDLSVIDEMPPGRQKIDTFYVNESAKSRIYKFALEEINKGRQVYIVCPLVEENDELNLNSVEKLYNSLKTGVFKNISIAMLHGKMTAKNKNEIMNNFKNGDIKVLVSTTVIEVGINVPNATLMIVENAERFGLSQLHQLRGRVGRGVNKSYCILIAKITNEKIKTRMEIIKNNHNGFVIAEEDLKLRGSGELFGFKQHGEAEHIFSNLLDNLDIFKIANQEAKTLLKSNDEDDIKVKNEILNNMEKTSQYICFN